MRPHSIDGKNYTVQMRMTVVRLALQYDWPPKKIRKLLGLSLSTISRILKLFRATGVTKLRPIARLGRPRSFEMEVISQLEDILMHNADLYLDELQDRLWDIRGEFYPISTLQRTLERSGLTRKVLRAVAAQRDAGERLAFMELVHQFYSAEQLVALDESAKARGTIFRSHGRSFRGQRAVVIRELKSTARLSFVPVISYTDGLLYLHIQEGGVKAHDLYSLLLNQVLPRMNPFPGPSSVLILDNAPSHCSRQIIQLVEWFGCHILYLPPYSPDFMPCEESISIIKHHLRRYFHGTADDVEAAWHLIKEGGVKLTVPVIRNLYRNSGYC